MKQPQIKISAKQISPIVLLPGDPGRVKLIGQYLTGFKIISQYREFTVGVGFLGRKKITICSTGIGCPSTAIAVEELIKAKAKYLIRLGTCGGAWRRDIKAGSLIIPTAAVRDEGTTREYLPVGFPALADCELVNALVVSAEENGARYFVGINRTHDAFYGNQQSILQWGKYLLDRDYQKNQTPILSSEMECSALFLIASLRNVKAAAILAVNADPEPLIDRVRGKNLKVIYQSQKNVSDKTVRQMIKVVLAAVRNLP